MSVTPHVGVWIETYVHKVTRYGLDVTPHVGVWIETLLVTRQRLFYCRHPHVGVWIETGQQNVNTHVQRHPPRGGVD